MVFGEFSGSNYMTHHGEKDRFQGRCRHQTKLLFHSRETKRVLPRIVPKPVVFKSQSSLATRINNDPPWIFCKYGSAAAVHKNLVAQPPELSCLPTMSSDKNARTLSQPSNRARPREKKEKKEVFKGVLDSPFRIQWYIFKSHSTNQLTFS